jgi:peptidoglycan hydrolase-like protein with peptidoglycan-binding domain
MTRRGRRGDEERWLLLAVAVWVTLGACGVDPLDTAPPAVSAGPPATGDACAAPDAPSSTGTPVPAVSSTTTGHVSSTAPATTVQTAPSTASPTTPQSPTTASTVTPPTTDAPPTTAAQRDLAVGASGADVSLAQDMLLAHGYWLPAVTGEYDDATFHAVTAFEKVSGLERDGTLSVSDRQALAEAGRPAPRSTVGHVIEVDLTRQVVLVVDDGTVTWTLDTSTGARAGTTPVGEFTVYREIDGVRISALGRLYRPKYVVGGVAMHGYPEVPPQPASHGCIRLSNDAMDAMWALDLAPVGTPVLIYRSDA